MRRSAEDLVKTYLGERTGKQVLAGRTKRGEGEKIHAVIWLCDLRDSTRLSDSLPVESFFRTLNVFFDCTAGAVLDQGGEILSYIGDAVFAIFPIGGTERPLGEVCFREEGACAASLAAAWDARSRVDALNQRREKTNEPVLEFGLAIHVGDVMYGNLGVPQRMQFTVIGTAANEAARLAGMCRDLGHWVLVSSAFPSCFPDQMISLGPHAIRGLKLPREIFTLINRAPATTETSEFGLACGHDATRPTSEFGETELKLIHVQRGRGMSGKMLSAVIDRAELPL